MATKKAGTTPAKKTATKAAPSAEEPKPTAKKAAVKTAPAKSAAKASSKKAPTHEQVAHLAHSYWEKRGRHHGGHQDDWFRAETELKG